jgi:hypothetical protein
MSISPFCEASPSRVACHAGLSVGYGKQLFPVLSVDWAHKAEVLPWNSPLHSEKQTEQRVYGQNISPPILLNKEDVNYARWSWHYEVFLLLKFMFMIEGAPKRRCDRKR